MPVCDIGVKEWVPAKWIHICCVLIGILALMTVMAFVNMV